MSVPVHFPQRRRRLPNRRGAELIDFNHEGRRFTATFGHDADGHLAEILLDCDRPDSLSAALARDAAILASLALQHGAPLSTLRRALTRDHLGLAAGPLGRALDLLDEERGR